MELNEGCPCGSGFKYENCCQSFHKGKLPASCIELLRARFSAYALNIPEYIVKTTHPASPQYSENHHLWIERLKDFSSHARFTKLEILDFQEKGALATAAFVAHMTYDGEDATFTEKSYFEKVKERWLYRSGQLFEGRTPNMITTGQMRLLPLAYFGNPLLREKAKPVLEITEDIKKLIAEMVETMEACDGLGLAAPQVHHSVRIFVIRELLEEESEKPQLGGVKICINPKISNPSPEKWTTSEGCLSIPTVHADVERPKAIDIEYLDLQGKIIKERLWGWTARAAIHENDHLDGKLFVDRLSPEEELKVASQLKNLSRRLHDGTEL